MNKKIILATLFALPLMTGANATPTTKAQGSPVSISAKGSDVRGVLCDLFGQVKKNYVIAPNIHFALYLSLDKVDFDEALLIVCHTAKLQLELQDGVYYVTEMPSTAIRPVIVPRAVVHSGMLPKSVLTRRVSTKLIKAEIRDVFAELGKQSQITIEVDKAVPAYKLTAYLNKTSLKYALDHVTQAAHLQYRFTEDSSILIFAPTSILLPDAENQVSLDKG